MKCPHCGEEINPKVQCAAIVQAAYDTSPHRCPFKAINGEFCNRHRPENLKIERDHKIERLKKVVAEGQYLLQQFAKDTLK